MGTRGFLGFVVDGTEKITYNHFDSYPEGLGLDVLSWLRGQNVHELRRDAVALRVVDGDVPPTDKDIENLRPWTNLGVSEQNTSDWYCLLRETQGDPAAILEAGYMLDGSDFPVNSLFAEYGYLVDLDDERFEVYEGFITHDHDRGRFARRESDVKGYYPVQLVRSWMLSDLPTNADFLNWTADTAE